METLLLERSLRCPQLSPESAQKAVAFLEREMDAGRLPCHDPLELTQICYGAVFTFFSDARFRARLLDVEPLSPEALARHRDALTRLLDAALRPVDG